MRTYQAPLVTDHVQPQDVVINLIRILIESAEGVDLVVSNVRNRRVN